MRRVDTLLKHVIKDLGIEDDVRLSEMKRLWNTVFREPLLSHMIPSLLTRGELLLTVDSPVWLQELNFCKQEILKKLTPFGVSAIRFRLGSFPARRRKEVFRVLKSKKLTETEQTFITETTAEIGDNDLKKTMTTVLGKAIASGKTKIRD